MTVALVVDASVGLKWALREPDSRLAEALLLSAEELLVPDFWLNEATNILWLQVHRKGTPQRPSWTPAEARNGLDLLQTAIKPTGTTDMGLHSIALDIALAVDHSPYDCLYAAFAIAMGANHVVVADGPLVTAMRRHPDPRVASLPLPLDHWARSAGVP